MGGGLKVTPGLQIHSGLALSWPTHLFLFYFTTTFPNTRVERRLFAIGGWRAGLDFGWGQLPPVAPPPGCSPIAVALMDWTAPQVLIPIKLLTSLIKRKCCHGTPADSEEGGREEGGRR